MELTHSDLNAIACKWLKRSVSANGANCKIALTEVGGLYHGEIADAWGFNYDYDFSVLVEAKVSRSDFLADKKKPHRNGEVLGMGTFRYYICPEGLIQPEELPDKWGLLWVNKRGHVKIKAGHLVDKGCFVFSELEGDWAHQVNQDLERRMMGHLLAKFGDVEGAKETQRALYRELNAARVEIEKLRNEKKKRLYKEWDGEVLRNESAISGC